MDPFQFITALQGDDENELLSIFKQCTKRWRERQGATSLAASLVKLDITIGNALPSNASLLQRLLALADGHPSLAVRDAALEALTELPAENIIMIRLEQCAAFQPFLQKVRRSPWTSDPYPWCGGTSSGSRSCRLLLKPTGHFSVCVIFLVQQHCNHTPSIFTDKHMLLRSFAGVCRGAARRISTQGAAAAERAAHLHEDDIVRMPT
jgi:hypothetical protein